MRIKRTLSHTIYPKAIFLTKEGFIVVLEKIKVILSEQFDAAEETITAETSISDDLGADSLDVVDIIMSVEDEFDIEVPEASVENIKTVGELVSFVEGLL